MSNGPANGYRKVRPRRRHRLLALLIAVVVLFGLLLAADRLARAYTENRVATELESNGFPHKPHVSIEGFPFLTQLISRDFQQVRISSGDIREGPLTLKSLTATLNDIRLNSSYDGGTVHRLTGSALITFHDLAAALASRTPLGVVNAADVKLAAAGPDEVKATFNVVIASGTATWRVTRTGNNQLSAQLVASTGIPASLLSSVDDITLPLPALPLGFQVKSVRVTPRGLVGRLAGRNVSFGS
jgi:LmeA-like phospholipid-binding